MDEARRMQMEVFRRMTPAQRLEQAGQMYRMVMEAWEGRIRRQHPEATPEELRAIRVREIMRFSPSLRME